MIYTKY